MITIQDILLPYQKKFITQHQKRKLWISSRQSGKSFGLAFIATQKALQHKNGLSLIISTGARAASEMLRKCVNFAEAVKQLSNNKIDYTNSADAIKFSNGSRILSLPSGNPAALRGFSAHGAVIIDEAQYIEHPEEVMAAIAPTLTRDPDSELIMASTPAGKNSWFYKQYIAALNDPNWYVQKTSIHDAIAEGLNVDINNLKSLCPDPDVWKMEYEAEFLSEYSSMIDTALLQFMPNDQMPKSKNVVGMDIGSTSDRTAIAIVSIDKDIFYVYDIAILHKASYEEQLNTLQSLHKTYNFQNGFIDANGIGNPIAEFANKRISARIKAFTWTGANKTPAFEYMRSKIFDRQLFFAEHLKPLITTDFQNVQRIITADGNIKYVAGRDENGHSDAVSALVLALQAAKQLKTVLPPMPMFNSSRLF